MTKATVSGLLQWFMIICATMLLMMAIFGCRAARELKKDEKAIARILGKKELSDKMFAALEISHPCKPLIISVTKKGKDSLIYIPKLVLDATAYQKLKDSLLALNSVVSDECAVQVAIAASDSYNKGFDAASKIYLNRPITISTPDTIYHTEEDGRRIDQLEKERDVLDGMYQQSEKQAETSAKLAKNRLYWLIGICAGIGLLLFGWIWSKFRKPIKK